MSRLPLHAPDSADPQISDLLARTQAQLGRVPNLYATMANAPAALAGYLDFRAALGKGRLTPLLREQLALLVASDNGCTYCVSAHSLRGSRLGLTPEALNAIMEARSDNATTAAALVFARRVLATHGRVSDADLAALRAAGWDDAATAEIVAHVALNLFSNMFNHVAEPELDFPRVEPLAAVGA